MEKELSVYTFKEKVMEVVRMERYDAFQTKRCRPFIKRWYRLFD